MSGDLVFGTPVFGVPVPGALARVPGAPVFGAPGLHLAVHEVHDIEIPAVVDWPMEFFGVIWVVVPAHLQLMQTVGGCGWAILGESVCLREASSVWLKSSTETE